MAVVSALTSLGTGAKADLVDLVAFPVAVTVGTVGTAEEEDTRIAMVVGGMVTAVAGLVPAIAV